jgi:nucleoside-diphosphate-sugar epimerase
VVATTRQADRISAIEALGATGVALDVFDALALQRALVAAEPEVVINQLTALPKRVPNPRRIGQELGLTSRLRSEVTPRLVEAAATAGARRVVSQSIAFVYRPGEGLASESDQLYDDCPEVMRSMIASVRALEQSTLAGPIEGVVLRYGYFYGPGTYYAPDGDATLQTRRRRFPVIGGAPARTSMIHVEDAAAAAALAVNAGSPGIYNVVDDDPATMAEFLDRFAEIAGAKRPYRLPTWLGRLAGGPSLIFMMRQQRGVSNAKATRELGLRLAYPSWRDGLRDHFRATAVA